MIHPAFLDQLPTPIVECFPFLTTAKGQGIHEMMMHQFLNLAMKGILFGTYCASINEMKRMQYSMQHISYLDHLAAYVAGRIEYADVVVQPFAPFGSPGEYHGVELRPKLLRTLFL